MQLLGRLQHKNFSYLVDSFILVNAKMISTTGNTSRLLLPGLVCGWLTACGDPPTPPEEAVRAWVAQGEQAAEDKDRRALVNMISPAYADARGNQRDDIENMFRLYFLRQHNIALLTSIEGLQVFGDSAAELELNVGMAATNDGVLGFSADAYRFEMELERDEDDWLLISARWGEVGGDIHGLGVSC